MILLLYLVIIGALVSLDQWVKQYTVRILELGQTKEFLPGFMQLRSIRNYGAAWSSFEGQKWLLLGVTSLILIAVAVVLLRKKIRHPLGTIACLLVLAGGIGNIIDRVQLGYVVDMLEFQFINYPVFNVADIFVVCGGILGCIYYLFLHDRKQEKTNEEVEDGTSDAPSES